MSNTRDPALTPQPSTVVDEPATPQAAANDWDSRASTTAEHPSSYNATPHTHSRRP